MENRGEEAFGVMRIYNWVPPRKQGRSREEVLVC